MRWTITSSLMMAVLAIGVGHHGTKSSASGVGHHGTKILKICSRCAYDSARFQVS